MNLTQIRCPVQMVQLCGQLVAHPLIRFRYFGSDYEGQTKVLVSINGPIEVPRRDELVSETTIDIQFRPVSGFPGDFNIYYHN